MIKFLIDESTGQAVADHLRTLGYDVAAVGEIMPQAPDERVIEYAFQQKRILISNDRDFGDKVYRDGYPHAGVVLLRLSDDRALTKIRVITALIQDHSERLPNSFVVATEKTIRIRPRW